MEPEYPKIVTSLPGERAKEIIAKDRRYTSSSYIKEYPLVIERGEGAMVEDVDGNRFLDFMGGIAVSIAGYGHPRIVDAIKRQSEKFLHICGSDFYYTALSNLAEKLAEMTPMTGEKSVFLTNSGTEAVETAIKMARYHTRRPNIIAFLGAFHGRSMGALSLTASKAAQRSFFSPLLPGVYHVPYGYCYKCPYHLEYGSCRIHCADAIENLLCRSLMSPEEIAAVVVEPIQGEGGYIVPPPEFHRKLRDFTRRHNILLVADEIQAGMGRTGRFLAIEHFQVEPDVVLLAKGLAAGLPLGAVISKKKYMSWEAGTHGSTFGGNPLSCEAALEALRLLQDGLMANAASTGSYLIQKLNQVKEQYSMIGDVRGIGLMVGVELIEDGSSEIPPSQLAHDITADAFARGLLLLPCGESTIRFSPPLIVTERDVDLAVGIFAEIVGQYSRKREAG